MKSLRTIMIVLFLLLFAAVGSLRAATITVLDTVCYGDNYEWYHMGAVRQTYYYVTGDKQTQYTNSDDGNTYKLRLKCLKQNDNIKIDARITVPTATGYVWARTGRAYTTPGVYTDTAYYTIGGVKSDCIDRIYVLVLSADTAASFCQGETLHWRNQNITTSTTREVSLPSKYIYNRTYQPKIKIATTRYNATSSTTDATIFAGETYSWFGQLYFSSGSYRDTIVNVHGCDSIGVLNLKVCDPCLPDDSVTVVEASAIGEYFWPINGVAYTASTTVMKDVIEDCGCVHHYRLDLTVFPEPSSPSDTAVTICDGESFQWYGQNYSTAGVYPRADVGKTLYLAVAPTPILAVCPTPYIDPGNTTTISATGADYFSWTPAALVSNQYADATDVSPAVSTTFYVEGFAAASTNLVVNGDFEDADHYSGFYTELSRNRKLSGTGKLIYGTYVITNNPKTCTEADGVWKDWGEDYDHTKGGGEGYFMLVDGFDESNKVVWQETIPVEPHTEYAFSAWYMSVYSALGSGKSKAKLQFFVNGEQLGTVRDAPEGKGNWMQYYELWSSQGNTSATLTIMNQNLDGGGNDFGLDDISFKKLSQCSAIDSVDVIVNRYFSVKDTILYSELPYTWGLQTLMASGDYQQRFTSASGYADSIVNLHLVVLDPFFVVARPDCSIPTFDERPAGDSPDKTFTLRVQGDCATPYEQTGAYISGDMLKLKAEDSECWRFDHWSDGQTAAERFYTIPDDPSATELTAIFVPSTYTVKVVGEAGQGVVIKH